MSPFSDGPAMLALLDNLCPDQADVIVAAQLVFALAIVILGA